LQANHIGHSLSHFFALPGSAFFEAIRLTSPKESPPPPSS
jgi:hypothetical protein